MSMGGIMINSFLEQESLTLIFVALGIGIIGMAYGKIKNKDSLQMHRWIMTGAVTLNLIAIFVVMIPSIFIYFINPSTNVISSFSILQIIHGAIGFPAIALTVTFAFNDLPKKTKKWMIITSILWLSSIVLGAIVYFTMPS